MLLPHRTEREDFFPYNVYRRKGGWRLEKIEILSENITTSEAVLIHCVFFFFIVVRYFNVVVAHATQPSHNHTFRSQFSPSLTQHTQACDMLHNRVRTFSPLPINTKKKGKKIAEFIRKLAVFSSYTWISIFFLFYYFINELMLRRRKFHEKLLLLFWKLYFFDKTIIQILRIKI